MRVLVVEDHPRMADVIKRGLVEEGFAVDVAATGQDGIWYARENEYDAVILDVLLPDVDGFEVLRAMREAQRWAPVVMLTARDGVPDRVRGLDLGADDYMTKPFAFPELLARLRALMRRGARERPALLEAGDLRLDPAARTVHRGDTALDLTAKEFAVLELLVRRAGEVLPKSVVIEHVWDFASDADPNLVEVYIASLRRKVDKPFGKAAIETVRGAGYRFRPDGG